MNKHTVIQKYSAAFYIMSLEARTAEFVPGIV